MRHTQIFYCDLYSAGTPLMVAVCFLTLLSTHIKLPLSRTNIYHSWFTEAETSNHRSSKWTEPKSDDDGDDDGGDGNAGRTGLAAAQHIPIDSSVTASKLCC